MPVGFARSLLGGSGSSLSAASQAATVTQNNITTSATGKFNQAAQTIVSASAFDSLGYVTVFPSNGSFYLNGSNTWTIEFFLGHFSDAPASQSPAGIFRLEDDLNGTITGDNLGNRIIQYSDGQPRFRFYNPAGTMVDQLLYSSSAFEHLALVCSGSGSNNLRWYANGSSFGSAFTFSDTVERRTFSWGQKGNSGTNNARIQFDEMRVSSIARYSGGSYTVPTSAFTTDQHTLALIHFDGNLDDSSQ